LFAKISCSQVAKQHPEQQRHELIRTELLFRSFGVTGTVVADGVGVCEYVFGKR